MKLRSKRKTHEKTLIPKDDHNLLPNSSYKEETKSHHGSKRKRYSPELRSKEISYL